MRSAIKIKQRDTTDCGAACLASIAAHFDLHLPVFKIRQYASTDTKGTNVRGLIEAAEHFGFSAKGVRGELDCLKDIPKPAIAHVKLKDGYFHYVVIYKVTDKHVVFMDPGDGLIHKKEHREFKAAWTGVLILLVPGEAFREGNEKVSNWTRFWHLMMPHRPVLIQAFFGAVIYTLLGLASAVYIQKIVDHVYPTGNTGLLNLLGIGMLVILALQIFIGIARTIFMVVVAQQLDARLILGYYKHLLKLPQQFFNTMRVGEIVSRVGDAVKIRTFINTVAIGLVVDFLTIVFALVLMFVYSWKLALFVFAIIPFYIFFYWISNRFNRKYLRKTMEEGADLGAQLVESLGGIETIKRFGIEDHANLRTENRFIKLLKTNWDVLRFSVFSGNAMQVTTRLFTIGLLWWGSYAVLDNEITPGVLLSFHTLLGYFTRPAQNLVASNGSIQGALIAADRLFELMDLERETNDGKHDLLPAEIKDIRFEDLTFRYGSRKPVFESFSLTLPAGKTTAIVGESGSGKTTLAAILQKLYPLKSGRVMIGSVDLESIRVDSLRSCVSAVPQKIDLFGGTVKENIALGEDQPDMLKIAQICEQLEILQFIEELPEGFDTHLGERGTALSGGQQQRIAIARALYRDPQVLILDEATSHLDSKSERVVFNAMNYLREQGKTLIVIAHRLSTIQNADHVVVLRDGKLVEEGTFNQLLQYEGEFYSLWHGQSLTDRRAPAPA